jgi:DNA-binding MarR family transcriptional regulator
MNDTQLQELASLFFSMRQIIRSQLPQCKADPNAWLRFETMRFIENAGGPTMHDVAAYVRIKAPSATSLVGYLVGQGAVRAVSQKRDKRVKRLYLTAKGKRMLAEHRKRSNVTMRKVFEEFTDAELSALLGLLRRLSDIHAK